MKNALFRLAALTLLALLFAVPACAQEAENITAQCEFTASGGRKTSQFTDGAYTSYWLSDERKGAYVEMRAPEDTPMYGLYICFGQMPAAWEIQRQDENGQWTACIQGDTRFLHAYVPLEGETHLRLVSTGKKEAMKINELMVLGAGVVPDWVQIWQEAPEKVDLLVISAHPDDELIFFGGTVPTYAAERGMNVLVAYMTASNTTRSSELLNGLWLMGQRIYPAIGPFYDGYSLTLENGYKKWPKNQVRAFLTELIRRYRPDVVLTHDLDGEYGHGAHRVTADATLYCVEHAADASFQEKSAALYGTWQVKKLYLHLYPENQITMDWRVPLEAFGGKTGLELAREAYALHVTQQTTPFVIEDSGETSCALFGLAYTTVGADTAGGDFFENIVQGE